MTQKKNTNSYDNLINIVRNESSILNFLYNSKILKTRCPCETHQCGGVLELCYNDTKLFRK